MNWEHAKMLCNSSNNATLLYRYLGCGNISLRSLIFNTNTIEFLNDAIKLKSAYL